MDTSTDPVAVAAEFIALTITSAKYPPPIVEAAQEIIEQLHTSTEIPRLNADLLQVARLAYRWSQTKQAICYSCRYGLDNLTCTCTDDARRIDDIETELMTAAASIRIVDSEIGVAEVGAI